MKKGQTIKLRITDIRKDDVILYSNIKKQQVILPFSEIKTNQKNKIKIGDTLCLRIVTSRPKLKVSGKFVKNNNIIDDDSLADNVEEKESTIKEYIDNKIVTIKKKNHFDKAWTLFTPCSLPRNINKSYSYMPTNDIIPIISKADEVHLILGRAGLPSSILNELKWVNKYIKFKLIAKSEEIKSAFSDLKFSDIVIDNKVDFNYLGIIGKENLFLIIDLDNIRVDDTFEKIFFENQDLLNSFELNSIKEVYVIDKHGSE